MPPMSKYELLFFQKISRRMNETSNPPIRDEKKKYYRREVGKSTRACLEGSSTEKLTKTTNVTTTTFSTKYNQLRLAGPELRRDPMASAKLTKWVDMTLLYCCNQEDIDP